MVVKRGLLLPDLKANFYRGPFLPLKFFMQIFFYCKTCVCPLKSHPLNSTFLHCLNLPFPLHSLCPVPSLKGTLARDFLLLFFSSKATTWSPDSYPKFISNIKSNSPRYSNYSALCVDSVNAELIFCFKLYKNCKHFLIDIGSI
jgi:hypothetical protein